jgi:hypothetical protein
MKISFRICGVVLCILLVATLPACSCGGDTSTPSNVSVLINNGAASTSSPTVMLSIAATDNIGVTGYYISESSTKPSATAPDWTSITSTISYAADVPFILSTGNGTKTIYVWFKDDGRNVSAPATASITLASTLFMITPYVNETDMSRAGPFSSSDNCPWGYEHRGFDFFTTGDLKPFQAVCSGVVDMVELFLSPGNSYWQVNVNMRYDSIYSVHYAFEPCGNNQSDGQMQLDNILVSEGQAVSQGDIIGYLYSTPDPQNAHVDWGFYENGVAICPEPYFIPEARDSMLRVVHKEQPGWDMCYDGDGGSGGDTTAPSNVSLVINNGAASTSYTTVTLSIAATDNVGVAGYYISENSTTPSATASGWTSVTSTISYSANVSFTLSSGDGAKTIYVWFKDDAGNVSAPATASITLASTISMITPYANETDMRWAGPFSSSDNCPWGYEHRGFDFFATGDLKPFQAVCSGVVDSVELWVNPGNSYWQVNVIISFNPTYVVVYAFEPFSSTQSDGQIQLANILVSEGDTVSQGDIIGYLYRKHEEYAHVDFGLVKEGDRICPEPYFTPEARDSMLRLIHKEEPGWDMCY